MLEKNQIQDCVFDAIDRVNEVSLDENTLAKNSATVLTGDAAQLDSMGFVNFVVALEESLAAKGLNISLVEEMNAKGDALPKTMTVAGLVDFLLELARKRNAAGE